MGSRSTSNTTAIDNRLAVTDQAFGLSSSGSANQLALDGHIVNANSGGAVTFNTLDGGAVNKAFDFAAFSLSEMLGSVIDGQKQQTAAANYQSDTIGQALRQSAAVQAQAQAQGAAEAAQALRQAAAVQAQAQSAAAAAQAAEADKLRAWLTENGKILAGGAAFLLVGWWVWKGRK